MNSVIDRFLCYAKMPGGVPFFQPNVAISIIEECRRNHIPISGLEAVIIADTYTQPFMEHSVDYSDVENVWDEAVSFIKSKEPLGLYFEVIIQDHKS